MASLVTLLFLYFSEYFLDWVCDALLSFWLHLIFYNVIFIEVQNVQSISPILNYVSNLTLLLIANLLMIIYKIDKVIPQLICGIVFISSRYN